MASIHFHPTSIACNLTPETRARVVEMIAKREFVKTFPDGTRMTVYPVRADGWRLVVITET